jgi:hypothetical protein
MAGFRKATLRKMPPITRQLAEIYNQRESGQQKLKNMISRVQKMELKTIERDKQTETILETMAGKKD